MIELPAEFLSVPRWWTEGAEWLGGLPRAVERHCGRWGLEVVGPVTHGSNAIVVPVARGGDDLVLRMSPPGKEVEEQVLRWWDGRGMVLLYDADAEAGAMLLERLSTPLTIRPVDEAVDVLGQLMRRLAVPAPDDALATGELDHPDRQSVEIGLRHRIHRPLAGRGQVAEPGIGPQHLIPDRGELPLGRRTQVASDHPMGARHLRSPAATGLEITRRAFTRAAPTYGEASTQ